jgi:SpoVK/Ycf46/Vps4 family AAA+-type ATPase
MRSGRFSTHIHVGLPNAEARETIIRNRLLKIPHAEDIDLKALAKRTDGYNAADVEEVCRTAKMRRISLIDSGEKITEVSMDDFDYALTKVHSSVSKKDLKDIEEYRRTGCAPDSEGYKMNDIPAGEVPPGYC